MSQITPAQVLAERAGTSLEKVARAWPVPRPGLSKKQIASRVARIRRAVRQGGLHEQAARALAAHLGCSFEVFLHGAEASQRREHHH